jgi:hypothetical protein
MLILVSREMWGEAASQEIVSTSALRAGDGA